MSQLIQLFDFDGGIHPPENKHQSNHRPIRKAPLPDELVLPLHQHIGAPSKPVVSTGDTVLKGQIIAEPEGFVSAPLHAPTSGIVKALELRQVPHASGLSELCIVIEPDGKDTWIERQSLRSELGLSDADALPADEVVERIRNCGIAGLGGAGFPTAVKLHTGDHNIDTLILNGAECEPYITADDMLMREHATEVIRGAVILQGVLTAQRCLIGVEDNKPEAIEALNRAVSDNPEANGVLVVTIPTKYPSGGEKQLIQILTGKEVPSGGIPASLGIVCQNVATAAAIADAVDHGLPLISRITTVTGDAVRDKGNWEVLFGTPVSHLLNLSGYRAQKRERVVMGGPMMGFALPTTELPVVKTTNCLLAPTEKELPTNNMAMACIRCGMCADACPADLLPQQLYWFSKAQELDKAEQHNLFDCIECGACSYVCPSEIPLVQYYRHSKGAIREERAAAEKAEHARIRYEARIERQEREKAEKEAKRKARAEATAKAQDAKKAAAAKKAEAPAADPSSSNKPSDKPAAAPSVAAAGKPDPNSLERLKKKLDSAESRLEKARQRLSEAEAEGSEKVPAIREALEAQQAKALEAKAAYEAARNPQPESPAPVGTKPDPNSLERLKKKWDSAESRLEKAKQRLSEAEAEGSEKVDAIREAFETQKAKAAETKLAYESALNPAPVQQATSPEPVAEATPKPDPQSLERLKKKWDSAESRLEKAKQRLSEAEEAGSDKVEAIREALEAQQAKAIETKAAYEAALNPKPAPTEASEADKAPEINNKPDPNSPERLKKKWDSAESRLEKAKQRLSEAEAAGSDKVEAIREAMLAQQAKAAETKAAYEAACAPSLSSFTETEESQPETADVDPELEKLKRKVLAQKDRVEKARERLNMAREEGLGSVEALERALNKQIEKLADLEAQTSSAGEA